jgi:hypothetical protein
MGRDRADGTRIAADERGSATAGHNDAGRDGIFRTQIPQMNADTIEDI